MKIKAKPLHILFAGFLSIIWLGCFIYTLILFPYPLQVLKVMIPMLFLFAIVYIPYYRDHKDVTYYLDDKSITLRKNKQVRRSIPLEDILSVRNSKGSVLIRRRGFWHSSECLHPMSGAEELVSAIEKKLQNQTVDFTKKG